MLNASLTHKERQTQGLDILGTALRPLIDERMTRSAQGKPWVPHFEAKESARLGRRYRADPDDPRQLLRILGYERGVFTEIDAAQRAWIDELAYAANRAAHDTTVTRAEADRSLDTMTLLADSLGLDDAVSELTGLQAQGAEPAPADAPPEPAIQPEPAAAPGATPSADPGPPAGVPPTDGEPVTPADRATGAVPPQAPRVPMSSKPPEGTQVLSVRSGDLDVVVFYREAVNYALVHNRVSPIASVRVTNNGEAPIADVSLTIQVDTPPQLSASLASPLDIPIGPVAGEDSIEVPLHQLTWRLNPAPFVALDEAVLAPVHLTVRTSTSAGTTSVRDTADFRLLTADEWWSLSIPEVLAAFVRPNAAAVITLLSEASELLQERTGSPSLEGYQSGPERVHHIAEAIYDAMAARNITYVQAPASFEDTGQRIRTHAQVLDEGRGNCLDLACTYAAALEQAGLHPVIAIVEGHAFTGYLTAKTELPAVALTAQGGIATVADSDVFDAVETSALCVREEPIPFDQARGLVRRWWRADLDKVAYLLDVHAAHRSVKPMPSIRLEGGVRVVEVVREAVQVPLRRTPALATSASTQDVDTPHRFQRWQRALLDMTFRNPLLRLKQTSSIAVHVPADSLPRLEDKIASGEHIGLRSDDELAGIHIAQGARTAADMDAEALRTLMDEENALFVALNHRHYSNRLRTMQRRARTSLEETGTDNLYLALGTLHWSEDTGPGRAPLFLAPVRLTGGRGHTRFGLEFDDTRQMEPNHCLVEKLRVDWGLEIPELIDPGEDEYGIDVAHALSAVRSVLLRARATMFHVEETAHLALLQFSTLEMWRDLRKNWSRFMQRPVVKHLVEVPGQPFVDGIEPPEPEDAAEATSYLPIPADGSQIEAVRWAAAGKSFILEGPPGTGKSQTITNLVAHCLAEGKKVLFVAEKQAALDVVKKRLDEVGLGTLSLDLHGKNQTASSVREQLDGALDIPVQASSSWEALRANYRTLIESLARYPQHLHGSGPMDMSAWDARQVLLELEQDSDDGVTTVLDVPRRVVMGEVLWHDIHSAARDLGNALLDLGTVPEASPWRLAGPKEPNDLDRNGLARALHDLQEAEAALTHPAARSIAALARTPAHFAAVAAWLETVHAGAGRGTAEAGQTVTPPWRVQAQQACNDLDQFRSTQSHRLGDFLPGVLDLDLDGLVDRSVQIDSRFFGKKKRRQAMLAELQESMRGPASFPLKQLTDVLRGLAGLRGEARNLVQHVGTLPGIWLPHAWNPLAEEQADVLDRAIEGLETAADLRVALSADHAEDAAASTALDQATADVLTAPGSAPPSQVIRRIEAAWVAFWRHIGTTSTDYARWLGSRTRGQAFSEDVEQWAADASGTAFIALQRWVRMRSALARLEDLGLAGLSEPVWSGAIGGTDVDAMVRRAVTGAVLDERLDATGLSGFDGRQRSRLVERFVTTGTQVRGRMATELASRIVLSRTFDPNARAGTVAELRQQLSRRRGGLSVRRLMDRFGSLITQITPCFLMSPSSVARFLPADAIDFDVVVFDEASQIRVPEAIGAMGRGQAVVIVGDSKQMPPSSMFAAAGPDEDDDEQVSDDGLPVPVDLESILSEGVESRLPQLLLTWHYRSRDESLIAFSNSRYYDGRLSSFPTPPAVDKPTAIHLRKVDGTWEGGSRAAARINRAEADAVVAEIQECLAHRPEQSIGVVTFNTPQRDHILNLLDEVRQDDSRVEAALTREDEPLFVKNLENVQGDERDTILFTLAFAADDRGRVPLNWGPLSRTGGERRLNVAVTRAKEQVVVFCSFEPHELDLTRSSSTGLADLKDYLLAARRGVEASGLRRAEARDLHLEDVQRALQRAGLEARARVGLSDFTVDLAVRAGADRPWVAVMLDGPGWAARTSVGDREGLPATVLTGRMGWSRTERVWLPAWVRDHQPVVDRIVATANDAHREEPARAPAVHVPVAGPSQDAATMRAGKDLEPPDPAAPVPFKAAPSDVRHDTRMLDASTASSRAAISAQIIDVTETEGPILAERLARIVAARFGLSRVTESRRQQILAHVPRGLGPTSAHGERVYWPEGTAADSYTGFRAGGEREFFDVPYLELRNGMVATIRGAHGMSREEALRETARLFGVSRLGSNVRERLEGILNAATEQELLVERDGLIVEGERHAGSGRR